MAERPLTAEEEKEVERIMFIMIRVLPIGDGTLDEVAIMQSLDDWGPGVTEDKLQKYPEMAQDPEKAESSFRVTREVRNRLAIRSALKTLSGINSVVELAELLGDVSPEDSHIFSGLNPESPTTDEERAFIDRVYEITLQRLRKQGFDPR